MTNLKSVFVFIETLITGINDLITSMKDLYCKNLAKRLNNSLQHKFFDDQCTPLKNDSVLPTRQMLLTSSRLCTLNFNEGETIKIIKNLNVQKAYGHDVSIRMITICNKSILKPLIPLFRNLTKSFYYPDICKISNIEPVHKNNDKRLVNNYRPISLLLIFGKLFEKIIFNRICNLLLEEKPVKPYLVWFSFI